MEDFLVITFASTNFAMQTEAVLKAAAIKNQIIPTPREITLSCGLSIMTPIENYDKILAFIGEARINNKALYKMRGAGSSKVIEEIGV